MDIKFLASGSKGHIYKIIPVAKEMLQGLLNHSYNANAFLRFLLSLISFSCKQLNTGAVWVQFNDGSQLVVQPGVSTIIYTDPNGQVTRYGKCLNQMFLIF